MRNDPTVAVETRGAGRRRVYLMPELPDCEEASGARAVITFLAWICGTVLLAAFCAALYFLGPF
jgi:hypothetical protein